MISPFGGAVSSLCTNSMLHCFQSRYSQNLQPAQWGWNQPRSRLMQESGTVWDIFTASHTFWDLLRSALKPFVTCDWMGGSPSQFSWLPQLSKHSSCHPHSLFSSSLCLSGPGGKSDTSQRCGGSLARALCLACLGAGWIHCNGRAQHLPNLDTPLVLMKHNKTLCHRSDLSFTVVHLVSHR